MWSFYDASGISVYVAQNRDIFIVNLYKDKVSQKPFNGKYFLNILMTVQNYASQCVKRFHSLVSCALNMKDLISDIL